MSTITRVTNYVDGDVLDAADLNDEFDNLVNNLNALNNENIAAGAGIAPSKISASIAGSGLVKNGTTGALEVNPDNVTTEISSNAIRVKDSGISAAKLASDSVTTLKIVDGSVTRAKLGALDVQVSGFQTDAETSSTLTDLAGLTVTLTTTGRPVMLMLKGNSSSDSFVKAKAPNGALADCTLAFLRDSTVLAQYRFGANIVDSDSNIEIEQVAFPCSAFWYLDVPAAGTYTYKLQGKNDSGSGSSEIEVAAELVAYELW